MKTVNYFKALADETRLRLLNILSSHELNVNEIVSAMEMGQSRISRHLKILTDNGLLTSRRDGLWIFYRSSDNGRGKELLDSIENFMSNDNELKDDLMRIEYLLENNSKESTEFFDSIAPGLNKIKSDILGNFNISDEITREIVKNNQEVIADLGCGTGELLIPLSKYSQKIIGVDRSPKMLDEAMEKISRHSKKIKLRIGAIEHLPMSNDESDMAIINMVLHYLQSPSSGIMEAGRVLKTGGSLIIADLDKHSNESLRTKYEHRWLGFSADDIEKLLIKAGFKLNKVSQFPVEHGLSVNLFYSEKV